MSLVVYVAGGGDAGGCGDGFGFVYSGLVFLAVLRGNIFLQQVSSPLLERTSETQLCLF